jgi:hypothetical protein
LVCGLCSGTGHARNPHLSPVQTIGALVSSLGDRADFTAAPGKLAILVVAYEEVRECGWRGNGGRRHSAAFWSAARTASEHTNDENAMRLSHQDDRGCSGRDTYADTPVLDAVFSGTGSWIVPQPIPHRVEAMSPRYCGIAA